jgi:zinc D-Ala-D-Ala dipeptidase
MPDLTLAAVPVHECGEPLVDVESSAPLRVAARPTLLRFGIVERLVVAQSLLPRDVRLLITEGHRSSRWVRPEDDPHATGGAADLALTRADGEVLTGDPALLAGALSAAGLVNCPAHWWHWSYGDRHWARVTSAPQARYGPAA